MSTRERFPAPIDVHSYLVDIEVKRHIYMETGLLDLWSLAPLDQAAFLPANLVHNAQDAAGEYNGDMGFFIDDQGLPEDLDLENRNDSTDNDGKSKSGVGCDLTKHDDPDDNEFRTTLSISNPVTGEQTHYGPPDGPWCKDTGVFFRKYCQSRAPASQWTGKMQWFVQALYGSDREDYDYDLGLDLRIIDMPDEPLGFSPYFEATAGIFTDGNFNYWLIRPQSNGVFARLLRPESGEGKALQKRLKAQGATGREEYYLLSTLRQSERFALIGDVSAAYDFGSPWFYGWHYNADGSKADVVCINPLSNGSTSNPRHEAAHFRMSLSYTPPEGAEDGPINEDNEEVWFGGFTVTLTTVESAAEFTHRNNRDLVWWPLIGIQGMEVFVPKPLGTGDDIDSDVPMYCYYDQNDQLVVIRFQRDTLDAPWSDSGSNSGPASPSDLTNTCGEYAFRFEHTANAVTSYGFYTSGGTVSHDGRARNFEGYDGLTTDFHILEFKRVFGVGLGGLNYNSYRCPGTVTHEDDDGISGNFHYVTGGQLNARLDVDIEALLVIPVADASAVYIGRLREFQGDVSNERETPDTEIVHTHDITKDGTTHADQSNNVVYINEVTPGAPDIRQVKKNAQNLGTYISIGGGVSASELQVVHLNRFTDTEVYHSAGDTGGEVELIYIPTNAVVAPWSGFGGNTHTAFETGLSDAFDWNDWKQMFDPLLLVDPFIQNFVSSVQSLRGSYSIDTSPLRGDQETAGYDFDAVTSAFSFVGEA